MFDDFIMDSHLVAPTYLIKLPFPNIIVIASEAKQSRSFCDMPRQGTNISSSPKSAYPISNPEYRISFFTRIRSSKNSTIFYSKLSRPEGGIANKYPKRTEYSKSSKCAKGNPDLNGFLNQKQSASTTGRVAKYSEAYPKGVDPKGKPQLNGFEGGIADKYPKRTEYSKSSKYAMGKPDLNYFFPSKCDLTPESGIKSKGAFDLDLFSQTRWSSGSKMPGVLPGTVGTQGPFVPDSFRSYATVNQAKMRPPQTLCTFKVGGAERSLRSINLRFPQSIHSPATSGFRDGRGWILA